jgi:hypothetical protein
MWESAPAAGGAPAGAEALDVLRGVGKADAASPFSDVELVETSGSGGRLDLVIDSSYQADNLQFIQSTQCPLAVSDLVDELLHRGASRTLECE